MNWVAIEIIKCVGFTALFLTVGFIIDVLLERRKRNTATKITPSDASAALLQKALRHMVKGCETHMAICPYKEESLNGLVMFSKEVLSCNLEAKGLTRMANLEDKLMAAQEALQKLVIAIETIPDQKSKDEILKSVCLCKITKCVMHGKL